MHREADNPEPDVRWSSDRTLRVAWPGSQDRSERRVHALLLAIDDAVRDGTCCGVVDALSSATVVQIACDVRTDARAFEARVRTLARAAAASIDAQPHAGPAASRRRVIVPVCYDPRVWEAVPGAGREQIADWQRDLSDVAREARRTIDDVIALHARATYRVQFLGFAPGFAYLAGLPAELHVPRLPAPRAIVPAGAVAIAAGQTGVYALPTPGGWRVLGRTPRVMFDPRRGATLRAGDEVRFEAVPWEQWGGLSG
jgi:inhibitor of KinA